MSLVTYVAGRDRLGGWHPAATAVRRQRRSADGVVVRQPGHAGQRRRDGAQRPLPAEGRRRPAPRRSPGSGSTSWPARSCTSCCSSCSSPGRARATRNSFKIPPSSKLLVAIAVVLAVIGIVIATRWGRRILRTHVLGFLKRSWSSIVVLARSPAKLAALFGGSLRRDARVHRARSRRRSPRSTAA